MRIGLIRHFPVTLPFPSGWITASDLQEWLKHYDRAAIDDGEFSVGEIEWRICLSSDMQRARATAEAVFEGEIEHTPSLREPQIQPFNTGNLRLPFWGWRWMVRLAWMAGHRSQTRSRDDFKQRVLAMADRLTEAKEDTLVVSHAGMMAFLSAELRRRGFSGPRLRIAENARVYVYERKRR
jgi:broad specificity phosphatase PhoE